MNQRGAGRVALRRRGAVAIVAVALGALVVVPTLAHATNPKPFSTNIEDYVLFASSSLQYDGGGSLISGGNVGVNNPDPNPNDSTESLRMCTGGSPHEVSMPAGTQVVADTMQLGAKCFLGDVYYASLQGMPAHGTLHQVTHAMFPILTMPAVPSAPPCTGDLVLKGKATIGPGVHSYCNVQISSNTRVFVDPGATIFVTGRLNVSDGAIVGQDERSSASGSPNVQWYVLGNGLKATDNAVNFGRMGYFFGRIYAPNNNFALGHGWTYRGHYWAKSFTSDWGVSVSAPPRSTPPTSGPPPTSNTLPPTTTPTTSPPPTTTPTTSPPPTTTPTTEPPTTVPDTVPL
jgi:hypothetical protein